MAKFCTNCGQEVKDDQETCLNCGKILKKNSSSGVTQTNPRYGKSKITAGLLAIFLGAFGVHNFYLGYSGKATAQLLLTVLSCCVLSPITSLWGLIEGILILAGSIKTDGDGNPLVD